MLVFIQLFTFLKCAVPLFLGWSPAGWPLEVCGPEALLQHRLQRERGRCRSCEISFIVATIEEAAQDAVCL
jgi:hypothetical protein